MEDRSMTLTAREATPADADHLAALINAAYRVEDFFKIGDRIDAAGVLAKMRHGRFVVLEDGAGLAGCVYVEMNGAVGVFRPAFDRAATTETGARRTVDGDRGVSVPRWRLQ